MSVPPPPPDFSDREWKWFSARTRDWFRKYKQFLHQPSAKQQRPAKPRKSPAPFGTHLPLLTKCLYELALSPRGGVQFIVEHGCGCYSSPIIAQFCSDLGIERLVVESQAKWAAQWCGASPVFSNADQFADWIQADGRAARIGLALIDGDQHDRQRMLELCSPALFIVVHDTESTKFYSYDFSRFTVLETSSGILPETKVLRAAPP